MTDTAQEPMTAEQIHARLDEIAPHPDEDTPDHAVALSRVIAVDAQRMWHRTVTTPAYRQEWDEDAKRLWISTVHLTANGFAVVHLLAALRRVSAEAAEEASKQIAEAWEYGEGTGEWLWEHCQALGVDPEEINRLEDARLALEANPSATENARQEAGTLPTEGNI